CGVAFIELRRPGLVGVVRTALACHGLRLLIGRLSIGGCGGVVARLHVLSLLLLVLLERVLIGGHLRRIGGAGRVGVGRAGGVGIGADHSSRRWIVRAGRSWVTAVG